MRRGWIWGQWLVESRRDAVGKKFTMKTLTLKISAVALAAVMIVGCSSSQILVTLEASVAAAEVLINTLPGIDPALRVSISAAISELPVAFQGTQAELATTDSAGVKFAKISVLYAGVLANLKALPPAAQVYVSAIVSAINIFLQAITPPAGLQTGRSSPALDVGSYKHLGDRISALSRKM